MMRAIARIIFRHSHLEYMMRIRPFYFQDTLITYNTNMTETRGERQQNSDGIAPQSFTFAAANFEDDLSVHADRWEVHPFGDEILYVMDGCLHIFVQDGAGIDNAIIAAGEAIVVPRRTWHRLEVLAPGRLIAVTPRTGTELRPYLPQPAR